MAADVGEAITDDLKRTIEKIAKEENFVAFTVKYSPGSSVGDNYTSTIVRTLIEGTTEDGSARSLALIAKVSLKECREDDRSLTSHIFRREIAAYVEILPTLDECQAALPESDRFRYAKFYGGSIAGDAGKKSLVFEDLCRRGYALYDRYESLDRERLAACVRALARFHAASLALKARDANMYGRLCTFSTKVDEVSEVLGSIFEFYGGRIKKLIEPGSPYEATLVDLVDNAAKHLERFYDMNAAPYDVLCHCDCWMNNMLFKCENGEAVDTIFVDWQIVRNSSPVIDLSYVLMCCIDSRIRGRHYGEMIDLYYETLASNVTKMGADIADLYPRSIYRDHIKAYMKYGLIMALCIYPISLSNVEDTRDLLELSGTDDESPPLTEACCERMKGLFEDCIELNIVQKL